MKKETIKSWSRIFEEAVTHTIIDAGLINLGKPGHTREGSKVAEAHEGRSSAAYYTVGITVGDLSEEAGGEMLRAISALQIRDESSHYYGGFLWYREEREMHDSNAAFFILMPLVVQRLMLSDLIPKSHISILDEMMIPALQWFRKETDDPILYYPNKILSDGALLLGLARIIDSEEDYAAGIRFFERWLEYTDRRGWGWGENASLLYMQIILNALQIARISLKPSEKGLSDRLGDVMRRLIHYARFHDGYEFVPTIRSYNFEGEVVQGSLIWTLAGVDSPGSRESKTLGNCWSSISELLFEFEIATVGDQAEIEANRLSFINRNELPPLTVPREHKERIFDGAFSYTWIGEKARLGSLNRFPVIPGSYQWPTWGLAWQTFPVSFEVGGNQISFLRLRVDDGEWERSHPTVDKARSYLSSALFKESWYPNIQLRSAQAGHWLTVVRSMDGLHNEVRSITEEWVIPRFGGEAEMHQDKEGRTWVALYFENTTVWLAALDGIPQEREQRGTMAITLVNEGDSLLVRQTLYSGELRMLHHPRLECGWIVAVVEGVTREDAESWLSAVRVADWTQRDGEVPREVPYLENRHIAVNYSGNQVLNLMVDPHDN